jgi:hypothetical protein
LGGRNERHRKIERGGSALALGGCHFTSLNNNQMKNKEMNRYCSFISSKINGVITSKISLT